MLSDCDPIYRDYCSKVSHSRLSRFSSWTVIVNINGNSFVVECLLSVFITMNAVPFTKPLKLSTGQKQLVSVCGLVVISMDTVYLQLVINHNAYVLLLTYCAASSPDVLHVTHELGSQTQHALCGAWLRGMGRNIRI